MSKKPTYEELEQRIRDLERIESASRQTEAALGQWKGKAPKEVAIDKLAAETRQRVAFIAKPGVNQTVIGLGRPAVKAGTEEEWALYLASDIFGGMFTSSTGRDE